MLKVDSTGQALIGSELIWTPRASKSSIQTCQSQFSLFNPLQPVARVGSMWQSSRSPHVDRPASGPRSSTLTDRTVGWLTPMTSLFNRASSEARLPGTLDLPNLKPFTTSPLPCSWVP